MKSKFQILAVAVAAAITTMGAGVPHASAQHYPAKPIRMVIGFPPGGGTDIVGRAVAQKLAEELGQPVAPDNRGGGAGLIGADVVAHAAPDGYTILMAHIASLSILPSLMKLPYDPAKDFAPVTLAAIAPNLLVVHPSLPVHSVGDLVQLGKSKPGQLAFASPGSGSVQHLAGEMFKLHASIDMLHVPYKGSGQSLIDLVAGRVQLNFDSVPPVIQHVRAGKLRAIAVTSSKRLEALPAIPTIAENGMKTFDMSTWWGIVAPAGVSRDVVTRLNSASVKVLHSPAVKQALVNVGAETVGNSPEEFAAYISSERGKYAKIVKTANIKID